MTYFLPRQKPGPVGKVVVREALVAEYWKTRASIRSLARKYGVSSGTAWRWVSGKRARRF
ncbi:hypothetical protein [Meiothermus cerbereus]|uniref:hypothetical protein n=1 Tax=Meiothermus cerbereus TaxID=65552 RepID=UPI00146FA9F3|nr:hypothetical protein [Meiothermus cerbereus]